jgi:hypothetical protein
MMGTFSKQLALQLVDDRLRAADRHRTLTGPRPRTARASGPPKR